MSRQESPATANDEGAYFVTNNAQTGLAMTTTVAWDATKPFVLIQNTAAAGGRKIILDYIDLVTTAAGSAASGLTTIQAALYLDSILRYSANGTSLTANIACPNMSLSPTSVAAVYAGAITAAAASAARAITGLKTVRPTVSTTVADVVGELKRFTFRGGEPSPGGPITIAVPNVITIPMPPVVIGPQQSALLYLFYAAAGTPVAASYAPEVGWSER
jgi:hypothetical protein